MEQSAAQRRWDDLHKDRPYHDGTFTDWRPEPDDAHPYHYGDGVRIVVVPDSDPSPDDEFLVEESAGLPEQPVGKKPEAAEGADENPETDDGLSDGPPGVDGIPCRVAEPDPGE